MSHAGAGNLGIHRSDFLELGGFDPTMPWLEDTEFSWRAQLAGVPLTFRPEVVVHVRLRSTFLGMYHQGYQYGAAYAVLEHRYGSASPGAAGSADAPSTGRGAGGGPGRGRAGRARRAAGWLVDHLVGGRLAWRAGWVVGHRSRRAREVIAAAGAGPGPVGGQVGGQGL